MRRMRWLRSLSLAASVLLLAALPAAAQDKPPPSPAFMNGTEAFRRIVFDTGKELFPTGFQSLQDFTDLDWDPKRTILIVFGDPHCLIQVPRGLRSFVRGGGALFLATDRPLDENAKNTLAVTAGVSVSGNAVICKDKDSCYHELDYCPYIVPTKWTNPDLFRNLLSNEYSPAPAASNAPSHLTTLGLLPDGVHELATLPAKCYPEDAQDDLPFDPPPLFAVAGDVGAGRVLVMADHSVFINAMLLRKDNGNVHLSYNCLKWLADPEHASRTKVLFVEEGRINTRFEVPIKDNTEELAKQIQDYLLHHPEALGRLMMDFVLHHPEAAARAAPVLAEAADKAAQKAGPVVERNIEQVDEQDGFNRRLRRVLGDDPRSLERVLQVLAVLLAVLVVLYGCWKIGWRARHRGDLQGPLLAAALRRLAPEGAVVAQRRLAMERSNNLWEPAHDLAKQCLIEAGAPAGKASPSLAVQGGWLRRWTMTGRVKRLWRLAYGPPSRVTLKEWQRLVREVQDLKSALADGTVRFL